MSAGCGCGCGGACGAPPAGQHRRFIPMDTPPRPSFLPRSALIGLTWEADMGLTPTPVPRPFTQYQSAAFPNTHGSNVGPAAIAPRYGFSLNLFSPVDHWFQRQRAERTQGTRVIAQPFARGAKGPQRIRGRVIPYPPTNPMWRSITGRLIP